MSTPNQGKIKFTRHAPDKELVIDFDEQKRKIRADRQWVLFDYTTGLDHIHGNHLKALTDVVKQYRAFRAFHRKGLKLHVLGIASNSKKDPRFDNDALAKRRAKNVIDFLRKNGVAAEDISRNNHAVLGVEGQNEEQHRSVVVSAGLPANTMFKLIWFTDKTGSPLNFFDHEVQVWDLDWGLAATFKAFPHGESDFKPGRGSRGAPDGTKVDTIGVDLMMGAAGGEKRSDNVSLLAFSGSVATFSAGIIMTVNGTAKREKVAFNAIGTNPRPSPGPLHETETRTVELLLAKPEFDDVIVARSRTRLAVA